MRWRGRVRTSPRNLANKKDQMTWTKYYIEDFIATPAQMERFGINENFDAVRSDPRNTLYLVPLPDPSDEKIAECFADAVYRCITQDHGGFDSAEESEWCFDQCLINGRKYECEPEYAAIFEYMGGCLDTALLGPPKREFLQ